MSPESRRPAIERSLLTTLAAVAASLVLGSCVLSNRLRTQAISEALADVDAARISITAGVAELSIYPLSGPGVLIEGTADVPTDSEIDRQYRVSGGTAYLSYREQNPARRLLIPLGNNNPHWELGLNRQVPLELEVKTGVGEANLDLSNLQVRDLTLSAGVGKAQVTLPRHGMVTARVESGVGEVRVTVPAGVAVRVRGHTGLGKLDVTGRNLTINDGEYRTEGFEEAADRVDLDVKSGIGSVTVQTGG